MYDPFVALGITLLFILPVNVVVSLAALPSVVLPVILIPANVGLSVVASPSALPLTCPAALIDKSSPLCVALVPALTTTVPVAFGKVIVRSEVGSVTVRVVS